MRQILGKILALVAFAGFASGAQAIGPTATYDFGILDSSKGVSVDDFSGSFDNTFSFIQGAYPGATGAWSVVSYDLDLYARSRFGYGPTVNLVTWGPWSSEPAALVPIDEDGSFAISGTKGGLTSGVKYWFELQGSAGQASYTVTLAPVPEPEAWALFLSGLGLMAYVVRRRRNVSAA